MTVKEFKQLVAAIPEEKDDHEIKAFLVDKNLSGTMPIQKIDTEQSHNIVYIDCVGL